MKINPLRLALALAFPMIVYMVLPAPQFPPSPPNSLQSDEPGDLQDSNIKAYFTDLDRDQVMDFYSRNFKSSTFFQLPLWTIRLPDYPPEESAIRIMEQIKSSYLEELVHPLRESIFISVWEPKEAKDQINVKGRHFENKVSIKYYHSLAVSRLLIGIGITALLFLILQSSRYLLKEK